MPLLPLWVSNPEAVLDLSIEQIVTTAGNGALKDMSECSTELREFLTQVSREKLAGYIDHCLSNSFGKSGLVLQDLVNELGRRLEFQVTNGKYQGTVNAIGYDGIWSAPDGHKLVVEVKTTDAYRISLDTLEKYRQGLIAAKEVEEKSSILIVVGRGDTGELEAQVRGSRHAWDIRLISADALLKLVDLREETDDPESGEKIRALLRPFEYTKLDAVIDVMFSTAKDVATAVEIEVDEVGEREGIDHPRAASKFEFTDSATLDSKRTEIMEAVGARHSVNLIKRTRATYWNSNHEFRVACTVSKRYARRESTPYWYAYHPKWDEFLQGGAQSYLVLGCMDLEVAFVLPQRIVREQLENLNVTERSDGGVYWHVKIVSQGEDEYALQLPKIGETLPLMDYAVKLV